jgi:hypothetical protein
MTPKKQVSPAIRILRGERDASARATHLEAATRKFLVTTNERKQMSTKTNFKRIALVAVAALGMGVLSSVPSNAAVIGAVSVTAANGTATLVKSDTTTAASLVVKYFQSSNTDTASITVTLGSKPSGAVGGTDSILASVSDTSTSTGAIPTGGAKVGTSLTFGTDSISVSSDGTRAGLITPGATQGYAGVKFKYHLDSALVKTAGTYTLDYLVRIFPAGTEDATKAVSGQLTITVTDGTDGTGNTAASGTSTAIMDAATSWTAGTTVDEVVTGAFTPGTVVGVIRITQLTSAGDPARESITATIDKGNLGFNSSTALGKSLILQATADGIDDIYIIADGSSGTATITLKTTSVTFANKQATFYSTSVDKYEVTRLAKVIGSSSTVALVVKAIDASGNVIKESTNSTVYAYSDNLDAIATAATSASGAACSAYNTTYGGHYCSFSGAANGTANITIRNKSTLALSTKASTATAITVNTNPAAKIALSFDKATYAPGELAYLSVSAVDAAGNPVGPNAGTDYLATGGITSTAAFGNGSAGSESLTVTATPMNVAATGRVTDVALYSVKLYMPASGGTITASATGGTALSAVNQVKVTASATVTDNGAAALAAVNALATTVASLRTLITTLTNLVLKIQKKVKA